jgi:hypothetical protein
MTTPTRERYANGQLVKVLQTATVAAVIDVPAHRSWREIKTEIESRSLAASKKYEFTANGYTTYIIEVSYTAKGANRSDVTGRLEQDFGSQFVHCTYSKTVRHD